jgi:hypothetical protein
MISENERVTSIGSYWDSKGENEIDIIALNNLDKIALAGEVKRNPKKIDLNQLAVKVDSINKELAKFKVELKGYSMEDM